MTVMLTKCFGIRFLVEEQWWKYKLCWVTGMSLCNRQLVTQSLWMRISLKGDKTNYSCLEYLMAATVQLYKCTQDIQAF